MKRMLSVMISALVITSCATAEPATAGVCSQLDPVFSQWQGPAAPGFAVAVVVGGEVKCEQAYGKADLATAIDIGPDSRFNLASVTKPFVALAAVDAAQSGSLNLDAPISQILPGSADHYRNVTLRQMLSHTSGLRDVATLIGLAGHSSAEPLDLARLRALIDRQSALNFNPGERYLYSNSGYLLTASALSQATGRSFPELMAERVFRPAGMRNPALYEAPGQSIDGAVRAYSFDAAAQTWGEVAYASAAQGSTNLYASAGDVARWAAYFLRTDNAGDPRVRAMTEPARLNDGAVTAYGLGLEITRYRDRTVWMHTGSEGGFRSVLLMFPEFDAAVVVLGNGSVRPQALAETVADLLFATNFKAPSPRSAAPPALTVDGPGAAPFSGVYQLEPGRFAQIAYANDRIFLAVDPFGVVPVDRVSDDGLLHRGSGVTLAFEDRGTPGFQTLRLTGLGAPVVGRRVSVADAAPGALERLTGRYYSADLDVAYELLVENHSLLVAIPGQTDPLPLTRLEDGRFISAPAGAAIEFIGDGTLLLSTWRVNDVRFERIPSQAR